MQTAPFAEFQLSRLMLGTVQFGSNYGIANKKGQPSYADVCGILSCACEGGVNCLDTAAAYGQSEELIGRALQELGLADRMIVVSKVPQIPVDCVSSSAVERFIRESVTGSLKRLRLDVLPVCLFHRESDSRHLEVLRDVKDQGLVRHIGVSCDARPGPAGAMLAAGLVEALQLPANILDSRHLRSGVLSTARRLGVAIFIRSVYLQGLILMPEGDVPPALQPVIPVRRKLEVLARAAGLSLAELALRYMLSQEGVSCVITGVESLEQVRQNLALFSGGPLDESLLTAVAQIVPDLPETVISPPLWPRR